MRTYIILKYIDTYDVVVEECFLIKKHAENKLKKLTSWRDDFTNDEMCEIYDILDAMDKASVDEKVTYLRTLFPKKSKKSLKTLVLSDVYDIEYELVSSKL